MNPRCPECDVELDCSSDTWVCPLCRKTPRPEQYTPAVIKALVGNDPLVLRNMATGLVQLIQELVTTDPTLAAPLMQAYHMAQEIAERADQESK